MSQRPIPVENIGGRMEELPRDIRNLIEPMTTREYLRVRRLAEKIIKKSVPVFFNLRFINMDLAIDETTNTLIEYLGLNLDEFLTKYFLPDVELSNVDVTDTLFLYTDFYEDLAAILFAYPRLSHDTRDEILGAFSNESFVEDYIIELFRDAGYKGKTLDEVLQSYNESLPQEEIDLEEEIISEVNQEIGEPRLFEIVIDPNVENIYSQYYKPSAFDKKNELRAYLNRHSDLLDKHPIEVYYLDDGTIRVVFRSHSSNPTFNTENSGSLLQSVTEIDKSYHQSLGDADIYLY